MGLLFDNDSEEPKSKLRRYIITGAVLALLLSVGVWYLLRFHTEKETVETFFGAVVKGDLEEAYRIWKPKPAYTYQDFLDDWGEQGYYGPVKSYRIETAQHPPGASGVIVVVELSPFAPFPADNDPVKNRQMKEVHLWVERKTQSLSFPP